MRGKGMRSVVVALLLIGAMLSGCGGDASAGGTEEYETLLHGLEQAAETDASYNAVERAEDLKPVLRASLNAFCETNRELLVNSEAGKSTQAGYLINRIRIRAERELPFVSTAPVGDAVTRYRDLFGLDSFNPTAVRRYAKACYR
jgi:hypothetical protein